MPLYFLSAFFGVLSSSHLVLADSSASSGQRWNGSWSLPGYNDRSIALQQAQVIRQAEDPTPATVVNNVTDNRSGYIETNVSGGTLTGGQQIGNTIGQNTNSIGAMNTGNTQISINGNGNSVDAVNSADSAGCVDGSISTDSSEIPSGTSTSGIDISVSGLSIGKAGCN